MKTRSTPQYFISDTLLAISGYFRAISFIRQHQLWKGLLRHGWANRLLMFVGLLVGLQFLYLFWQWLTHLDLNNSTALSLQMGLFLADFAQSTYSFLFLGGFKYIILILMDAAMEHFSESANMILHNQPLSNKISHYIASKWRMVKIVVHNFFKEILATISITIILSLLDFDFLEGTMIFLAQCYYLGFAVIDTYNSQHKMTIKQSALYTQQFAGVAVGIGIVFHFLLLIPLAGPLLAPCLGSVSATLTMHQLEALPMTSES
ncbi:MAG: hypothetical protein ACPGXL_02945 [Chitinophagales bacterium]